MISNSIKALRQNKLKTMLIYASLSFSIIAVFLITAISTGIISMYSSMLKNDAHIIVTQAKISDTFFSNVDVKLVPQIEKIDGVKKVSAFIVGASPVESLPIVAIYGASSNKLETYKLSSGTFPKEKEVIVGEAIFSQLENKQKITIGQDKFKISGVFHSDVGFENGGVVMPLSSAGKLFNKSSSMLLIDIDLSKDIDFIIAQINAKSSDIEAKSTTSFIDNYNQFKILDYSSYAISSIAFLMGLLGIASIMSITVNERKDEFGIMKALGISSSKIIGSLALESTIIAVFSYITALLFSTFILFSIQYSKALQGYINGEITLSLALAVFITTILMALLGTIIPSYKASKIDPIVLIQRGQA